ncbi:hypothetical protein PpBr36_03144 [Pyricularia pennisetigena]|uniref:hypothetical protein n=1 Tax=Pyricularia pennisetigena TaxID=1578925 RepID=UPI00114DAF4E|nr:hypothetical protein PpBr36_03144 [Pyricularia pennisetigena]TLS30758.1 hypothetical protein PpBr36_03144 [Pyricularia pennisetigena]
MFKHAEPSLGYVASARFARYRDGSISAKSVDASGTATGEDSYVAAACRENKMTKPSRGYKEITVIQNQQCTSVRMEEPKSSIDSHIMRSMSEMSGIGNSSPALFQPKREYQGTNKPLVSKMDDLPQVRDRFLGQVCISFPVLDIESVTIRSRLVLPQAGLGGYQTPPRWRYALDVHEQARHPNGPNGDDLYNSYQ